MKQASPDPELLRLTAMIVSAHVANRTTASDSVPEIIQSVYAALSSLGGDTNDRSEQSLEPAVPIRKSVFPDYLVCLEDGRRFKMLKRHLRSVYKMTPQDYRSRWGLPPNYPMVAPNYAVRQAAIAKSRTARPTGIEASKGGDLSRA